ERFRSSRKSEGPASREARGRETYVSASGRARAGRRGVSLGERFAALARVELELAEEHVELNRVHLAPAALRFPQILLDSHEAVIGMLADDLAHEVLVGKNRLATL